MSVPNKVNVPSSPAPAPAFGQELKRLLHPTDKAGKKKRNTKLRSAIRAGLGISDSTLYFWQNPDKPLPKGRKPMAPSSAEQAIKLGLIIADSNPTVNRTETLKHWVQLAGYSHKDISDNQHIIDQTIEVQLRALFQSAQEKLTSVLFGPSRGQLAPMAAACFFSQELISNRITSWKNSGDGGHVLVFWKWNTGGLLKRLTGEPLQALDRMFQDLQGVQSPYSNSSNGITITIFVTIESEALNVEELNTLKAHIHNFSPKVRSKLVVFVEQLVPGRPQHFGDIWLFISPSNDSLPIMIVDYAQLHGCLINLDDSQLIALQKKFNPFHWASYASILEPAIIPKFLRDCRIIPPTPGLQVDLLSGSDRWVKLNI